MKAGWEIKTLGEVCDFIGGSQPPKSCFEYVETPENIRLIQIRDYKSDKHIVFIPRKLAKRFCKSDDVMIGRYGPPVFQILDGLDGAYNVALMKAVPETSKLERDFLFYFLQNPTIQQYVIFHSERSVGQTGITRETLEEYPILLPPLPEQKRLVTLLDEAFESIATAKANAQQNLKNARALFESHLNEVFTKRGAGYVEKRLDEVCSITSKLIDPKKEEFIDLVHVGAGNIESQTGAFIELKTAREEGLISGKFLFDESMVLYSKIRPYLMKVARPEFNGLCSADMYPLSPLQNQITRDYLFHLMLSKQFTEYAIEGSARAGMPKVNREHLFAYKVWLPKPEQQKELAMKLDNLHEETQRLEALYSRKIAALDELKKALLHRAFSGEL
jgi:type I restriction enzyme S subunit